VTVPVTVRDAAEITPAWLTAVLGTTVTGVRHEPVGTGQMAACYRLHLDGDGAPATLVAKLPPPAVDLGPAAAGAYRNEVAFYAELAPTLAVRAPACHHHAVTEDGSGFTLLLEDLAPARQGDQVAGCGPDRARDAVVNLAGLHGPRWCDPTLMDVSTFVPPAPGDGDVLAGILATATETFCDRYRDRLARADRDVLEAVPGIIAAWSGARPERFAPVHGDYRLDNLLFPDEGGGVAVVDWQTVSLGLPARDVAYFLGTCLPVEDRRAHEEALVAAYHAALVDHGVAGYELDDCRDDYRFGLLQGPLIAVLGAAFSQRTDRGDDMFMAMTARSCAAIRDHGALALAGG
jgi:Phosphotransferase enzyme family